VKEQTIRVEIDPTGRITADADGFTGDTCLRDLERLLRDLSPGTASVDRKPEAGVAGITRARKQPIGKKS